jgi:glyoxylase-like metal-dependent hydrolase (beta-lactamase superfamily II)
MGTHAFLYESSPGAKPILFDATTGHSVVENLESLGISPSSIETIFITHMHGDHVGGLVNRTAVFPNALVYIHEREYNYWHNLSDYNVPSAAKQGEVFGNYSGRILTFNVNGAEVNNTGVIAYPAFGHTPGHATFLLGNLLLWGDLTHAMAIQMPVPKVAVTYDVDKNVAVETRLDVLALAVNNEWDVGGAHVPWPALGTLKKGTGEGYIFTPFGSEGPSPDASNVTLIATVVAVVLVVIILVAIAVVCVVRKRQAPPYADFRA